MQSVKVVLVGDKNAGKTCLLRAFNEYRCHNIKKYIPQAFSNTSTPHQLHDSIMVDLALWDTEGSYEKSRYRALSYPDTNVVMICFSLVDPDSINFVRGQWMGEVRMFCHTSKVILVGTKSELRYCDNERKRLASKLTRPVSYEEGFNLAQEIGAVGYCECSARCLKGVQSLFTLAMEVAIGRSSGNLYTREIPDRHCILM